MTTLAPTADERFASNFEEPASMATDATIKERDVRRARGEEFDE